MNPAALLGRKLAGKYLVQRVLGEGGMGIVFEAENVLVGRKVALKVLAPELAAAPQHLARFQREARAAAAIGHPNIIDIYDFGQDGPRLVFFVMERLEGWSLAQALEYEKRFAVPRAVDIAGQTLDALGAAHRAGIVHRDVKPDNIYLCRKAVGAWQERTSGAAPRETVKVLDFGISMFHGAVAGAHTAGGTPIGQMRLTKTGAVLGTPWYMSPEQAAAAADIDHRTDIWAVGAILYQMLAGQPPFDGKTAVEVLYKVLKERPKPLAKAARGVPRGLSEAVERALAKEPGERFPDAESFALALQPFVERREPEPERPAVPEEASTAQALAPTVAAGPVTLTPGAMVRVGAPGSARASFGVRARAFARSPWLPRVAGVVGAVAVLTAIVIVVLAGSQGSAPAGGPAAPGAGEGESPGAGGVPGAGPAAGSPVAGARVVAAADVGPRGAVPPADAAAGSAAAGASGQAAAGAPPDVAAPPVPAAPASADAGDEAPPPASLKVTGTVGAVLLLDGERAGVVPATIVVPADGRPHAVYASKPGHVSGRWMVGPFAPGESGTLDAVLVPPVGAAWGTEAGAPPPGRDAGAVVVSPPPPPRDAAAGRPAADAGPVVRGPGGTIIRTRRDGGP